MKRLFIFLCLITFSFSFAQTVPYFSFKKTSNGIMIGVEVFNKKNKSVLREKDYIYEWMFPNVSLISKKINSNIFFLSLEKAISSLEINLKMNKLLNKESYTFREIIPLSLPKVKIIRKHNGFVLPLDNFIEKSDYLTFITKNFSSKNLQVLWEFNSTFISNEKEIPVSLLKEKRGIIKVRVYGNLPNETAVDFKVINIE